MNTKWKITGLAALPLAGLLAAGGTALAQAPAAPAGTQVTQQTAAHTPGVPCPRHTVSTVTKQPCDQQRMRDRDRDVNHGDQRAQGMQATPRPAEHARHGDCEQHADG